MITSAMNLINVSLHAQQDGVSRRCKSVQRRFSEVLYCFRAVQTCYCGLQLPIMCEFRTLMRELES